MTELEHSKSQKEHFKAVPAVYLLMRRDNEVLLLERANTGYGDGNYSFVAGHLNGDELGTIAMIREAQEEARVTIHPDNIRFVHVSHRLNRNEEEGDERIDFFYETWKWDGEIENLEPHKCTDLSWHPIDTLPKNILPYARAIIGYVIEGIPYSEFTQDPNETNV